MKRKRLRDEIKLTQPFANDGTEAYFNLMRTFEMLSSETASCLKTLGLSQSQYNVLRILRGAGTGGLSCREIGNRMIARVPDVTRLLDRLVRCGHVERQRSKLDARKMIARITQAGREHVERAIPVVDELHLEQFEHLSPDTIKKLSIMLEQVRSRPEPDESSPVESSPVESSPDESSPDESSPDESSPDDATSSEQAVGAQEAPRP